MEPVAYRDPGRGRVELPRTFTHHSAIPFFVASLLTGGFAAAVWLRFLSHLGARLAYGRGGPCAAMISELAFATMVAMASLIGLGLGRDLWRRRHHRVVLTHDGVQFTHRDGGFSARWREVTEVIERPPQDVDVASIEVRTTRGRFDVSVAMRGVATFRAALSHHAPDAVARGRGRALSPRSPGFRGCRRVHPGQERGRP